MDVAYSSPHRPIDPFLHPRYRQSPQLDAHAELPVAADVAATVQRGPGGGYDVHEDPQGQRKRKLFRGPELAVS